MSRTKELLDDLYFNKGYLMSDDEIHWMEQEMQLKELPE